MRHDMPHIVVKTGKAPGAPNHRTRRWTPPPANEVVRELEREEELWFVRGSALLAGHYDFTFMRLANEEDEENDSAITLALMDLDDSPKRVSMRPRTAQRSGGFFREVPVRRALERYVGKPWNRTYGRLSHAFRRKYHRRALECVLQKLVVSGEHTRAYRPFVVDPASGILKNTFKLSSD